MYSKESYMGDYEPPAVPAHRAPDVTRPPDAPLDRVAETERLRDERAEKRGPATTKSLRDIVASLERARAEREGAAPARERDEGRP